MKKFYIAFALLCLVSISISFGQEQNSDAIYTSLTKEYTLKSDGSWEYHYSHKLKLLTYYSIHNLYGEDFIVYNPKFQKLKINRSNTTMADGKLVIGPENALNEVLPGFAANAPAFNHLREMVVTHTGLERGCTEDFDYTLSSSKDLSFGMTGNETFWYGSPVENMTFIIHIPAGKSLNYKQYNIDQKPQVRKDAGMTTYTWIFSKLPAATREDFRPKEQQNRPRIVFSTAKNLNAILQSLTSQPAFLPETDKTIAEKAIALSKNKNGTIASMLSIQDFVANEINYQPVPLSNAAFRVRTPAIVYASNGGMEIEKALLMASMLRSAGYASEAVAVFADRFFDSKSSNLMQAEKFLVKVTLPGTDPIYLSPLQNDTYDHAYLLIGKRVVSLNKNLSSTLIRPDVQNSIDVNSTLAIGPDMLVTGKSESVLSGRYNPYLKLTQDSSYSPKTLGGLFEGKEIKECSISQLGRERSRVSCSLSSADKVTNQSEHYFLKFGGVASGIEGWHMTELISSRTEPLELPFPLQENYRFTITLPDGFELITPETHQKIQKEFGELRIEIHQEGRTLQVDRMITLKSTVIEKGMYDEFRSFINTWNNKKYKEFIIRKGPK